MTATWTRRHVLGTAAGVLAAGVLRPAFAADKPRIRVGQIGTSHAHASKLSVYRDSPDYDVVGIVEPDDARWEKAKEQPAYRGLTRMTEEQLFNSAGLAVVLVETAVEDLVPTGTRCLEAGFHIHLDKPAGPELAPFAKLLEISTARQRIVQMGYMLRYSPATRLLQRLVKEGAMGDVFEVTAVMSKVVSAGERKSLAKFPGGMMFELGCHVIDSVVGLLGKPTRIVAFPQSVVPGDGLRDSMLAVFEYPKATATVRSSGLEVDGGNRRQFVVCGTGGTLKTEPLEPPVVRLSLAKAHGEFKKGTQEVPMPKYSRYVGDAADMAAVIRGEKPHDYPPAHDLLVHECVLKASGVL
ncbi:Gfo/Idh/MocA family protein [Humisphaera borealis]|uniref:Gfo/Idh/MocA family oxidoreductase n=1 Tax=Humisphaera borealis TaxID=2807512 RepID=A0A7M2WU39_9BACT|nr:Gfo/Idh/MocA family oxidoreductase [Humisphaera borealis]QOV88996.1 Gfo/Idh/MocA family oxidoreductase [Humisphaera borealis]